MRVMYKRLDQVGLDVATLPDRHKLLARESSITCRNATVDWSSASDCVSIELLRRVLPPKWFSLIYCLRSPVTTILGQSTELQMISSMGNAVTFPLETLVFWAYAIATINTLETDTASRLPDWETFSRASVFGDDCILPTLCAAQFIAVMESVGFIVNKEKSFFGTEQFRESCGGDYLEGYDNRPFFLKRPTSTSASALEPWLYIALNTLLSKYKMYFGGVSYLYDKHVFRYSFSLFRKHKLCIKLVPPYFPDDSGLKSSDILRLSNHYPMKLSRIDRSHHGTYTFRYCSFKYRHKYRLSDDIQYALNLKRPLQSLSKPFKMASKRRNGGYIVAKGISCHWHVPAVQAGG